MNPKLQWLRNKMSSLDMQGIIISNPVNIKYLVNRYKLDVVGLGYKRIFKTLMISDSFIVATLFIITKTIDNIYLRLLIAFILVFPLFAGIYHLIAMYYKKESER